MAAASPSATAATLAALACLSEDEAVFLHDEIFVRQCYLQEGIELKAGDVVFDVGANIGLFALQVCRSCPGARVFAFEPLPPCYTVLLENVAAHSSVIPVCIAIGDRDGQAEFTYYPDAPGESTRHPLERAESRAALLSSVTLAAGEVAAAAPTDGASCDTYTCRTITVPSAMALLGLHTLDLLKLDCEGDELCALRGITDECWPSIRQIVMEVHDVNGRLGSCVRLLSRRGFTRVVVREQCSVVSSAGYSSFIPKQLQLYYVYATRARDPGSSNVGEGEPAC